MRNPLVLILFCIAIGALSACGGGSTTGGQRAPVSSFQTLNDEAGVLLDRSRGMQQTGTRTTPTSGRATMKGVFVGELITDGQPTSVRARANTQVSFAGQGSSITGTINQFVTDDNLAVPGVIRFSANRMRTGRFGDTFNGTHLQFETRYQGELDPVGPRGPTRVSGDFFGAFLGAGAPVFLGGLEPGAGAVRLDGGLLAGR